MVHIRRATQDDLETLVQLRLDFLQEISGDTSDALRETLAGATRTYLADKMAKQEFLIWVAEVEGKIVGTSGLVIFERPPVSQNMSGREGYIMNMYTVPEQRGKGIATAILAELMRFVKGTGAQRVWLHATKDGRPLYEQ